MASIIKRRKKFSVVYRYTDENGNERQKWESFDTMAEAKKRKLEVEFKQENNEFIAPSMKTINDLLAEYMAIYGVNTWAISTYEGRKALISNYISPIIGDMKLEDVTPRIMDKYYRDLLSVRSVVPNNMHPRNEFVSPHIVREIHKLLRNAFNQAVKWELMTRNPVEHATLPKEEHTPRDIWTADVLFKALDLCENDDLKLGMNLAFSCTLRMGELLGLTWDCVDFEKGTINILVPNTGNFIFEEPSDNTRNQAHYIATLQMEEQTHNRINQMRRRGSFQPAHFKSHSPLPGWL